MVWYSHLSHNFPQFIVIHTVKGFGIVNKAEIDVFLELSCFFHDPADVVGAGLVKVYKALIRLPKGTLSSPILLSMSEAFSGLLHFNKSLLHKSS